MENVDSARAISDWIREGINEGASLEAVQFNDCHLVSSVTSVFACAFSPHCEE
jgi:hypothetical protein